MNLKVYNHDSMWQISFKLIIFQLCVGSINTDVIKFKLIIFLLINSGRKNFFASLNIYVDIC